MHYFRVCAFCRVVPIKRTTCQKFEKFFRYSKNCLCRLWWAQGIGLQQKVSIGGQIRQKYDLRSWFPQLPKTGERGQKSRLILSPKPTKTLPLITLLSHLLAVLQIYCNSFSDSFFCDLGFAILHLGVGLQIIFFIYFRILPPPLRSLLLCSNIALHPAVWNFGQVMHPCLSVLWLFA